MKWLLILVLGLAGCYSPGEETDMSGNPQYAKSGGWSSSAKLRNNGTDNMALAVNFLANRQENEIPSKNYTVQFSVGEPIRIDNGVKLNFINPVAEISWSVEGNTVKRVVSVTNGAAVTGVGQAVKVIVRDRTEQGVLDIPVIYDVSITVAPGTRPSENQPAVYNSTIETDEATLSVPPGGLGTGVTVTVPVNAGVISAYISAIPEDASAVPNNTALVYMVNSIGVPTRIYDPVNAGFVPIIAQTVTLILTNNMPAGPGVPDLKYAVTFGIDG